jgi:hypothetical protein
MLFFELKKYMIYANLDSVGEGNWYVKAGENISLSVTIMDIDMGAQYGKGTQASCTGCEGLVATIDSLRNEQFFKEMVEGTDYTLETGVVANSTSGAAITIIPTNLPSGWYGVDVLLNDTETGATYYGWGWFEIRNFWVDVFEVGQQGANYTKSESRGPGGITVPVGGEKLIGVVAYSPPTTMAPPTPLQITGASVEGMQDYSVWPPLPVDSSKYNTASLGSVQIQECWGSGMCSSFPIYLINLTVASDIEESSYELSLRATASGAGSDIGTVHLTVSSYQVDYVTDPVSKMYEWPAVYATTENLTMIITGSDFNDNPYNITNVTVNGVFSEMAGRPIKMKYGQNYTNNCTGNSSHCGLDVFLSGFSSGMYFIEMEVEDNLGSKQDIHFEFEMKNLLFSVPKIYEGWTHQSSSRDTVLDAWNGEDSCERNVWQRDDDCSDCVGNVSILSNTANITFPIKNITNQYYWNRLCLNTQEGRWDETSAGQPSCQGGGAFVYVISNGTNVWINDSSDLTTATTLTNSSTFVIANYSGFTWLINKIEENGRRIQLKHAGGIICGRNDNQLGDGSAIKVVPPTDHINYSSFNHGPAYIVGDIWGGSSCQDCIETLMNITDRPVYVYHNTSHLWLFNNASTADFTDSSNTQGPVAIGSVIEDGYGGNWSVVSISSSQVTLKGENILANGVMVNTSLSTSGTIYIGELREDEMGFENKISEEKQGLDLDGDGEKNSTLFFLIIDSSTGYDRLAYSDYAQKWNFTNASRILNVNDNNRANRQVGIIDKLTLLSIDPRASSVKFYDPNARGDWADLGDSKIGDNVTIPIVVKTPDGTNVAANISIPRLKVKTASGVNFIAPTLNATEITGAGEIRINVSSLGLGAGKYEFEILADSNTYGQEQLNEWLWPRTTVRNFLVDSYSGYGGIITSFAAVSVESFNERTGRVRDLFTVNASGNVITGVMEYLDYQLSYPPSCTGFAEPSNAGSDPGNVTYLMGRLEGQYYAYMTPANASRIWIKKTDCDFSGGTSYAVNEQVNITLGTDVYMLYVLNGTIGNAAIGPLSVNLTFEPTGIDSWGQNRSPTWQIMSMNRSGTIYNVIFTNDTSLSYPQAVTWGSDRVSKAARIDDDGDFGDASSMIIGTTFSGNEYLSSVGPDPWRGLSLTDSSNLSGIGITAKPGLDLRVYDNTPVYLGKINESDSSLDTDVNLDGDKTDIFYMVAFDEFDDGSKALTRLYIDDDLNITEPWWANSSNVRSERYYEYTYFDFYGNEQGNISEQEGNPPTGMWGGNLRFSPYNESQSWEESTGWNIKAYNGTNLIIEKNVWQLNLNKTISLTVKVFDFSQNAIAGANVTLEKLNRFGGGQPYKELNESANDYTLSRVQNITDSNGYAMLKVAPPGVGWLNNAEYIASIKVEYGGMEETVRNWFRVGQGYK